MNNLIQNFQIGRILPIKQVFETSHNYFLLYKHIPNSIRFENFGAEEVSSEKIIFDIIIEFLKIEQKLNAHSFYTSDFNVENYLLRKE